MAAMSENEHKATGLELLLPDPEFIAELGKNRRSDPDDGDDGDDGDGGDGGDDYFVPYAA